MESVHAGENVELFIEQKLETLLAFVRRIYLHRSVLYHVELLFELLSV